VVQVLLPLVLIASGFAAGGLMIAVLGGAPLQFVLPVDRYIPVHQFLTTRFDPFMPINLAGGFVLDMVLVFVAPTTPVRILCGVAGLFLISSIMVSLTKNYPINKWVATLDPENLPENWAELDPRVKWRNWNSVRAAFAVVALVANVTAVGTLL
jgi:uncharacterized membrane protein